MWQAIKMLTLSHRQTKYFIITVLIYMLALIWTTLQSYARLEYSRTDTSKPIIINIQPSNES